MTRWPPLARIRLYTLLLLTCMLAITARFFVDHMLSDAATAKPARDFIAFWATSKLSLAGMPEMAYDLKQLVQVIASTVGYERLFAWLYPPTFQIFVMPLAWLPYRTAFVFFSIASLAIYYYSARKLVNEKHYGLAILAFPAVYLCIIYGQNSLITAALAMLGLHYLDKRPVLAGFFIGLLAVKPQMAMLFPVAMVIGRHWRAAGSAILTQVACVLASLLLFGSKTWLAFIAAAEQPRLWLENGSLSWEKMISVFALARIIGADVATAYIVHGLIALLFIGVMINVWRRSDDLCLRGSSLILATMVTTPYAHEYELVWFAPALLLLSLHGQRHGWLRWQREALLFAWLTPLFNWVATAPAGQQPSPLPLLAELAMLATLLFTMHRPHLLPRPS